jgi:hypothetical protein
LSLATSEFAPPRLLQLTRVTSGSISTGERVPQMSWKCALASELPHWPAVAHRIGMVAGGAVPAQSVFTSPAWVRW